VKPQKMRKKMTEKSKCNRLARGEGLYIFSGLWYDGMRFFVLFVPAGAFPKPAGFWELLNNMRKRSKWK
jgi:hypothetical protein